MIIDYLSFHNEYKKPIEFWFYMEEDFTVGDYVDPMKGPYIKSIDLVPSCKISFDDGLYTLNEYTEHISTQSISAIKEIQKEVFKVRNRKEFLNHMESLILEDQKLFKKDKSAIIRDLEVKATFNSSEFHSHPIKEEDLKGFYRPFFQAQYDALLDFKERFYALYENEIKIMPPKKKSSIVFKYEYLYRNNTSRQDLKDSIEGFVDVLRNKGYITNKTIQCFLTYFGLSTPPLKIKWSGEYIGDFYTLYRSLDELKVVSGHDKTTLPDYIEIKDVNWKNWHSMKHTKNRRQIEKITDTFAKELEVLHDKYSAQDTASAKAI